MARSLAHRTLIHRAMESLADHRQLTDLGLDVGALSDDKRRPHGAGREAHHHRGLIELSLGVSGEDSAVLGIWQEKLGASRSHITVLAALIADSIALADLGHVALLFLPSTESASVQNRAMVIFVDFSAEAGIAFGHGELILTAARPLSSAASWRATKEVLLSVLLEQDRRDGLYWRWQFFLNHNFLLIGIQIKPSAKTGQKSVKILQIFGRSLTDPVQVPRILARLAHQPLRWVWSGLRND